MATDATVLESTGSTGPVPHSHDSHFGEPGGSYWVPSWVSFLNGRRYLGIAAGQCVAST